MANIGGSANSAFYDDGIGHAVNPGRANAGSITMAGGSMGTDIGLQDDSDRWAGLTPHGVMSTAVGTAAPSGIDFEGAQRLSGNPSSPGAFGKFQDEMSGGADTYESGEE